MSSTRASTHSTRASGSLHAVIRAVDGSAFDAHDPQPSSSASLAQGVKFPAGEYEVYATRCTVLRGKIPHPCRVVVTPAFVIVRVSAIGGVMRSDQMNWLLRGMQMEKRKIRRVGSAIRISNQAAAEAKGERPAKSVLVFVREADRDRVFTLLEKACSQAWKRVNDENKIVEETRRKVRMQLQNDTPQGRSRSAAFAGSRQRSEPQGAAPVMARATLVRQKIGDRTVERTMQQFAGPSPWTLAAAFILCLLLLRARGSLRHQASELHRVRLAINRVPANELADVLASSTSPFVASLAVKSRLRGDGRIRPRKEAEQPPFNKRPPVDRSDDYRDAVHEKYLEGVKRFVRSKLGEDVWRRVNNKGWDVHDPRVLVLMDDSHESYNQVRNEL